jgi:hypothetical protein
MPSRSGGPRFLPSRSPGNERDRRQVPSPRLLRVRQPVVVMSTDHWGPAAAPDREVFESAHAPHGAGEQSIDLQSLRRPADVDALSEILAHTATAKGIPKLSAFFVLSNVVPAISVQGLHPPHFHVSIRRARALAATIPESANLHHIAQSAPRGVWRVRVAKRSPDGR